MTGGLLMKKIIFFPNANIMHQERIINMEFLPDEKHVKLKTEVEYPIICKGDIRNYPEWPIADLSIRIEG
jgi:hypothetical protein